MSFLYQVIDSSLKVPGVKINREDFLRGQLSQFYSENVVNLAIEFNPNSANIPQSAIDRIAKSTVNNHIRLASLTSFGAGVPGGITMLGTVPADMTQFYVHVVILAQKLAFLYGWPEFSGDNETEVLNEMLMMLLGVMMGVAGANKALIEVSKRLAVQVARRVPQIALTKYAWYNMLKVTLKWVGIKVTKASFAKALSKAVPIVGGVVSGSITYFMMSRMSKNLIKQLKETDLHNLSNVDFDMDPNEVFDIEVEIDDNKLVEVNDEDALQIDLKED